MLKSPLVSAGSLKTGAACSEVCLVRTVKFPSSPRQDRLCSTVTSSLNSNTAAFSSPDVPGTDVVRCLETQDKLWNIFILICHLLWHINLQKGGKEGGMEGAEEGRGRKKKAAPTDSCVSPPLLLHWSGGGLSDLLKGSDQNNCSVQENTSHSSPRTPWWLHSNSTLPHMTDGSGARSLSSFFFCRVGGGGGGGVCGCRRRRRDTHLI